MYKGMYKLHRKYGSLLNRGNSQKSGDEIS